MSNDNEKKENKNRENENSFFHNILNLDTKSKWVFGILLFINVVLLVSTLLIDSYAGQGQVVLKQASNLLFAVSVAITFSIADRIGLLAPIQTRMSDQTQKLEQAVNKLSEMMRNSQQDTDKNIKALTEEVSGYEKYRNARMAFGFNTIVGLKVEKKLRSI